MGPIGAQVPARVAALASMWSGACGTAGDELLAAGGKLRAKLRAQAAALVRLARSWDAHAKWPGNRDGARGKLGAGGGRTALPGKGPGEEGAQLGGGGWQRLWRSGRGTGGGGAMGPGDSPGEEGAQLGGGGWQRLWRSGGGTGGGGAMGPGDSPGEEGAQLGGGGWQRLWRSGRGTGGRGAMGPGESPGEEGAQLGGGGWQRLWRSGRGTGGGGAMGPGKGPGDEGAQLGSGCWAVWPLWRGGGGTGGGGGEAAQPGSNLRTQVVQLSRGHKRAQRCWCSIACRLSNNTLHHRHSGNLCTPATMEQDRPTPSAYRGLQM